jgi:hypothetical protein
MAVIALALGTTTITTMQIQPAYSQVSHCVAGEGADVCITTGQNPSIFTCGGSGCTDPDSITHQQAGSSIGSQHRACAQGAAECFINHP